MPFFSPCRFIAFDLLRISGKDVADKPMVERRELMLNMGKKLALPMPPDPNDKALIQLIESFDVLDIALNKVTLLDGEGIVAKEIRGAWQEGRRTTSWIKVKNLEDRFLFHHSIAQRKWRRVPRSFQRRCRNENRECQKWTECSR
ncbi:hypothetical protein RCO48_34925 [Peribacillus frigoritolerans]|nr:hypothetical protein [Peribacillus frigoritolerans]